MAEEMIESWESDEAAEDWESYESIGEYDEAAEDIGERARRRVRRRPISRFRPNRGVQGMVVRGPGGTAQKVPFPQKLATAAETNRAIASQEAGRKSLEEKLDKLENRMRGQMKMDAATTGLVTLALGGSLTAFGVFNAAKLPSGSRLGGWAGQTSTQIAAVTSATQLATSGARLLMNGYHRSPIGIAADVFSGFQLATFAFASLYKPEVITEVADVSVTGAVNNLTSGTRVFDNATGGLFVVVETNVGKHAVEL